MSRAGRLRITLALLCLSAILSGCGFFSDEPHPSTAAIPATPSTVSTFSNPVSSQAAQTPAPTPRPVRSIALVADVGESQPGTASATAWLGVQHVASSLQAMSSMTVPKSQSELSVAIGAEATSGAGVVVTIGGSATSATVAAAMANPSVEFFTLDQAATADAPPNLHAIAFDEVEMGYLAGMIAEALSRAGSIGLVGDDTSVATANYAAGVRNGALFDNPAAIVGSANAGTPDDPAKGRAAAATLAAGAADVIVATSGLTGIGAMREACAKKALVVALGADAWQLVPDVHACLAVSVRKMYDLAIEAAIRTYAEGAEVPGTILSDVAAGGIALSDFHVAEPPALASELERVLGDMRVGPPRPTAPLPTAIPSVEPSPSPDPASPSQS
jgi:basic membrane protein A and related proteins